MKAFKITTNGNFEYDSMYWLVIADSYAEAEEKFKTTVTWKADKVFSIEEMRDFKKVIL